MLSGRIDRKIILQEPSSSQDSHGQAIITYPESGYKETFANVRQQSSRELFYGGKVSEVESVFTVRYRSDVDETWRISYNSEVYEIMGKPREIGRQQFLEIMARKQSS